MSTDKESRWSDVRITYILSFIFALAAIVALILIFRPDKPDSSLPDGIHLPAVEADDVSPTGQKTTWSCVYFGSYPTEEVIDDSWNAVDAYALQEGDVIRDNDLYARLEKADWTSDTVELDGVSYIRICADDVDASTELREQHYVWEDNRTWHYFRISPIRWRVLDVSDNKALLLADRMPDSVPYNTTDAEVTWSNSSLRSWLNGYFADHAFSDVERDAIVTASCRNLDNQDYGTECGEDTEDRVFILSNEEVFEGKASGRYGFHEGREHDDPAKRFTSTLYAKCRGAWWSPVDAYKGNSFWFMRTNGYNQRSVTYICDFGFIYSRGTLVTCSDAGVLPAIRVDLGKAVLEPAGEVKSTDIMNKPAAPKTDAIGNPVTVDDETQPGKAYTVWNSVSFGQYPQTEIKADTDMFRKLETLNAGEGEDVTVDDARYIKLGGRWFRYDKIIWRVLEVTDGEMLLLSDRALDCVPFNTEYCDVSWDGSGIRQWLNGGADQPDGQRSFIDMAFTEEERKSVPDTEVSNADNYYFKTHCGTNTNDKVFILSEEEVFSSGKAVRYGFRPDDAVADAGRRIKPTDYAIARGAWRSDNSGTAGNGFWILRTNGYTGDNVVYVGEKGYLYNRGIPVTCKDAGIVPAIRIKLDGSSYVREADITGKIPS